MSELHRWSLQVSERVTQVIRLPSKQGLRQEAATTARLATDSNSVHPIHLYLLNSYRYDINKTTTWFNKCLHTVCSFLSITVYILRKHFSMQVNINTYSQSEHTIHYSAQHLTDMNIWIQFDLNQVTVGPSLMLFGYYMTCNRSSILRH